ncbi:DUF4401 domain-containing protein [Shewanella sp. 10N.286.52.B9]|uniref:DUF4401 domain-containing protein n=1 Tax=Shewanella sp. 10N.286.52.B9 TaxID=1880837 RepID=UPI000C81A7C7|nr:DUF4401 domain-containing protein [Shewanella sp. 10N.286.52.B9]PMG41978.1 hypothetical protein BCU91_09265 [Shewanella sp. 10N.286.52.B9]
MNDSMKTAPVNSQSSLWQSFLQHGLVVGEQPAKPELKSPWFVKLLLAISGWFAALFFLGFLAIGMEFIFDNEIGAFIVGTILTIVAYVLFKSNKNEFVEHLSLAISFSGQILIVYGFTLYFDDNTSWLLTTLLQFSLMAIMPNDIHRFCSALFGACCFIVTLALFQLPFIGGSFVLFAACWLWLHEFDRTSQQTHINKLTHFFAAFLDNKRPIAYGFLLAQLLQTCLMSFQYGWYELVDFGLANELLTSPWMGNVLMALVSLYVVWQLLKRHPELPTKVRSIVLATSLLISALSFEAHGINVAILLLVLGFSASNRLLIGLGIISLLAFMSAYYYFLHYSLLEKSFTLMFMGVFLLAIRWIMLKLTAKHQELTND